LRELGVEIPACATYVWRFWLWMCAPT